MREKEGFPFPHVVRRETRIRMYAEPKAEFHGIRYNLEAGAAPFGPPPEIEQILDDIRQSKRDIQGLSEYGGVSIQPAIEFVKARFATDSHVAFTVPGGYRALEQIFGSLIKAPNQGTVRVFDIGMDFPGPYKFARRYATESHSRPHMPYYTVPAEVGATLNQNLEQAIDMLQHMRLRDFVVVLTNPSSPKGDVADPFLIDRLAYITARRGDLLIIDEVFADALEDKKSSIPITEDYPGIIVIRSLSKEIGFPGARIGYMVMSKELKESYEGILMEYDLDAHAILIATGIFDLNKPHILFNHLQNVREQTAHIKEPFVEGLRASEIYVFQTDNRVPIFFIDGGWDGFCDALASRGVRVARGGGFANTYVSQSTHRGIRAATISEALTNKYARVTIPKNREDVPKLIAIFKAAKDANPRRPRRIVLPPQGI